MQNIPFIICLLREESEENNHIHVTYYCISWLHKPYILAHFYTQAYEGEGTEQDCTRKCELYVSTIILYTWAWICTWQHTTAGVQDSCREGILCSHLFLVCRMYGIVQVDLECKVMGMLDINTPTCLLLVAVGLGLCIITSIYHKFTIWCKSDRATWQFKKIKNQK